MCKWMRWTIGLVCLGLLLPACRGVSRNARTTLPDGAPAICSCGRIHAPEASTVDPRTQDLEWIVKRFPK